MLMGQLLAKTGLNQNKQIIWLPSYGAEVRGGTAHCYVVISDDDIVNPYIQLANTCIIMNEPSLLKFENKLEKGGLLLINSSLVNKHPKRKDINVCCVPFTELAEKLGNIKIANCVALGAYIAKRKIFSKQELFKTIEEFAPQDKRGLIEINKQAVCKGIEEVKK
jgi:2-oxoglutarate ferredoxin oxidoreductase subunit gamma